MHQHACDDGQSSLFCDIIFPSSLADSVAGYPQSGGEPNALKQIVNSILVIRKWWMARTVAQTVCKGYSWIHKVVPPYYNLNYLYRFIYCVHPLVTPQSICVLRANKQESH